MALHKNHFQCHKAAACCSDDCFISSVTALVSAIAGLLQSLLTNEDIQTSALMGNMWSVSLHIIRARGRDRLPHRCSVVCLFRSD